MAQFAKLVSFVALVLVFLAYPLLFSPIRAAALSGISGTGSNIDPYQITTCNQLGQVNNDLGAYFVLANDIDCSGVTSGPTTFPIGATSSFSGSFDGQGHAITGLVINSPSTSYVGLFSKLSGSAMVQKLSVSAEVTANANVGIIAGRMEGTSHVSQVDTHGSVTCANNCGGLAGTMQDSSSIGRSWSDATIGGAGYTYGGLVGWVNGSSVNISDVYHSGDVMPSGGTSDNTGGIVGFANNLVLTNAYSTGSVSGGHYVGGIVGTLVNSTATHTFTTANVIGVGMGPVFGGSIASTSTDNYYFDSYSMPSDGYGSVGVTNTQEFIQNSTSPVFSTWSFSAAWIIDYQDYPALRPLQSPVMLCGPPGSTDTTISAHCLVLPRGWGIPTWQAQYQQQGASTWNAVTLSDTHIGQASVSGLQPGTWYNLQFRYTNNYGVSPWGTVQILTTGNAPVAAGTSQTNQVAPVTAATITAVKNTSSAARSSNATVADNTTLDSDSAPATTNPAKSTSTVEPIVDTPISLKDPHKLTEVKKSSSIMPAAGWFVGILLVVFICWLIISARPKHKPKKHAKAKS